MAIESILAQIDEEIAKLEQIRSLLANTSVAAKAVKAPRAKKASAVGNSVLICRSSLRGTAGLQARITWSRSTFALNTGRWSQAPENLQNREFGIGRFGRADLHGTVSTKDFVACQRRCS